MGGRLDPAHVGPKLTELMVALSTYAADQPAPSASSFNAFRGRFFRDYATAYGLSALLGMVVSDRLVRVWTSCADDVAMLVGIVEDVVAAGSSGAASGSGSGSGGGSGTRSGGGGVPPPPIRKPALHAQSSMTSSPPGAVRTPIEQVMEVFPEMDPGYAERCLSSMDGDSEATIIRLLEVCMSGRLSRGIFLHASLLCNNGGGR